MIPAVRLPQTRYKQIYTSKLHTTYCTCTHYQILPFHLLGVVKVFHRRRLCMKHDFFKRGNGERWRKREHVTRLDDKNQHLTKRPTRISFPSRQLACRSSERSGEDTQREHFSIPLSLPHAAPLRSPIHHSCPGRGRKGAAKAAREGGGREGRSMHTRQG